MNKRRRLTGMVKSNKMEKTVIVEVTRTFQHPLVSQGRSKCEKLQSA